MAYSSPRMEPIAGITTDHEALPDSLWANSAAFAPLTTQLSGDKHAQYLIIGGGFTGLSAALNLAKQGKEVIVLEANDIGFGGSGRNVGFANASLWLNPDKVEHEIGKSKGLQLFNTLVNSPQYVFSLIEQYKIDCEMTKNGTFHMAHSKFGVKAIETRAKMLEERGENIQLLNRQQIRDKSGIESYHGAIFHPDAGTVQPLSYARGLAKAAQSEGVTIHTSSPVTSLTPTSDHGWKAITPTGTVTCEKVLLATNGYTGDLWPGLKQTFVPVKFFQLATKPLSADLLKHMLPEEQGCWDTKLVMTAIRRDKAGRIILGSVGNMSAQGSNFTRAWGNAELKKMFPQIFSKLNVKTDDFWEFEWVGNIAYSNDHIPHVHELAPNLITCLGYSGRGISPGTIMGKLLAEYFEGADAESLPVPFTKVKPIIGKNFLDQYYQFGSNVYHMYERVL